MFYRNFTRKIDPKKFYSVNLSRSAPNQAHRCFDRILTFVYDFSLRSIVYGELSYFVFFFCSKKSVPVTPLDPPNFGAGMFMSLFEKVMVFFGENCH